jgi:pimeloyl-ACP methyl ester carboxylesterase
MSTSDSEQPRESPADRVAPRRMHVHRWGAGPPVVLVHGGILGGREAWRSQRPLTERWTLLAPDRPGHGQSPPGRQDFEPESVLVAEQLLDQPVHLVGMSYGAIISMYAAALRPENVRSLTIVEPPCTGVVRGVPVVDAFGVAVREVIEATDADPVDALRRFFAVAGAPIDVPETPTPVLLDGIRQLLGARPPDEADPPLDRLRAAGLRILVVSGGHSAANEIICDVIARETAGERAVCAGAGHLVPDTGEPFNRLLEQHFLAG